MPTRSWSAMRTVSLVIAVTCGVVIVGTYLSAIIYTGRFKAFPEFNMLLFALTISGATAACAHVRDHILAGQQRLLAALEDLPLHIADYGDRREVGGHQLATRVGATQRRGLSTVE